MLKHIEVRSVNPRIIGVDGVILQKQDGELFSEPELLEIDGFISDNMQTGLRTEKRVSRLCEEFLLQTP